MVPCIVAIIISSAQAQSAKLVERPKLIYAGIKKTIKMDGLKDFMQADMPKVFAWLNAHKIKPAGPEFLRYTYVDMGNALDIEVCVPISKAVRGDQTVRVTAVPAGKFASLTHIGDFGGLYGTNGAIQNWIKSQNLTVKMQKVGKRDEFVGRLEVYKSGPWNQTDVTKWETEVLYMVK